MNRKRILSVALVLFMFFTRNGYSQMEQTNWYMGFNAGCTFLSGSPVPLNNGVLNTTEGSASWSDATTGNLLFYTDGITAFDATHNPMAGGSMFGNPSSTQSGVIVPFPGNPNLYYIFTTDQGGYGGFPTQGACYSIVDMTLNGGLGAITTLNVLLLNPSTEKIAAVKHCNGVDYWVLAHEWNSNRFFAWLVTNAGVSAPVISSVGSAIIDMGFADYNETIGYMKFSVDGQKVSCATYQEQCITEVFDFNNITGVVSNPITLPFAVNTFTFYGPYGTSFSPDGTRLYVSCYPDSVFQYDLTQPTPAAIVASRYTVTTNPSGGSFGALQLGPDDKLYLACAGISQLDVINNPNALGAACGYSANAVNLAPGVAYFGLPAFIDGLVGGPGNAFSFDDTTTCAPSFTLNAPNGGVSYLWSTTETTQTITVTTSGQYWVSVTGAGCNYVDTVNVNFIPLTYSLGPDLVVCNGTTTLNGPGFGSLLWSTGATTPSITVSTTGDYWLEITGPGCVIRDTVHVDVVNIAVNLGPDVTTCDPDVTLNGSTSSGNYLWSNNATSTTLTVTNSGTYWLQVSNLGCVVSDTIVIDLLNFHNLFSNYNPLCVGQTATLSSSFGSATNFIWNTGFTGSTITSDSTATFWVTANTGNCVVTDTFHVEVIPDESIYHVSIECLPYLVLEPHVPGLTYDWSNNATSYSITVDTAGIYWVNVSLGTCSITDTIIVEGTPDPGALMFFPNAFTPNGDGLNDNFRPMGDWVTVYHLMMFDRWGKLIFETRDHMQGWMGLTGDGIHASEGVYTYVVEYQVYCGGDRMLKRSGTITLMR